MTELTNKEIEQALNSTNIAEIWNVFKSLDFEDEESEFKKDYLKVKNGIKVMFGIRNVTKGFVEELPQFKIAKIARKQEEEIESYWDELDERERIMKNILRSMYDDSFDSQREEMIDGYK